MPRARLLAKRFRCLQQSSRRTFLPARKSDRFIAPISINNLPAGLFPALLGAIGAALGLQDAAPGRSWVLIACTTLCPWLLLTSQHCHTFPAAGKSCGDPWSQGRRGACGPAAQPACPKRFSRLHLRAKHKFTALAGTGQARGERAARLRFSGGGGTCCRSAALPTRAHCARDAPPEPRAAASPGPGQRAGPGNLRHTAGPATEGAASIFRFVRV